MQGCRPLTDDEIKAIVKVLEAGSNPLRNVALFKLGLTTGFRCSELTSLCVKHVCDSKMSPLPDVQLPSKYMKGGRRPRTVPLLDVAREAVMKWIQSNYQVKHDDPLWLSRRRHDAEGDEITRNISARQWRHILRKAMMSAGIEDTKTRSKTGTHTLRKTVAKKFNDKHKNLMELRDFLGHLNVAATEKYLASTNKAEMESKIKNLDWDSLSD